MEGKEKYRLSFFGEFADKSLEKEFLNDDMKYYSRFFGPVAVLFGVIYMLFAVSDCITVSGSSSLTIILLIRTVFLIVSVLLYTVMKKINHYSNLIYLITAYEMVFFISFIAIIYEYGSIGLVSFFSIMAIVLAVYITPNRLMYSQIISVCFSLLFFLFYTNCIENIESGELLKLIEYNFLFIVFGNIQAYLTNFYRRKRFADSRELFRISVTDSLTDSYNRLKFDQELDRWYDYCTRYETPLSLVMFDIDEFKKVNDKFGHLAGDSVLKNTASLVRNTIRNTDIFARWGGDEFVILLPNTDSDQALELTERVRSGIRKIKYEKVEAVTCSFGLVSLHKNESTDSLLKRADKLLYQAKERGRDTVSSEDGERLKTGTYTKSISLES